MGSQFINIPTESWQSPVPSATYLPTSGNNLGDARVAQDTATIYVWNGSSWVAVSGGGGGGVSSVTASSPLASSGGSTPNLTITTASASASGALSSADWSTFNNKAPTASPTFTTQIIFGNYHVEPSQSSVTVNSSSTSLDLSAASGFVLTLQASTTISLVNPQTGGAYALKFIQGASAYAVSWQAGVLWPSGAAPIITVANAAVDKISLYYDGSHYLASYVQNFS